MELQLFTASEKKKVSVAWDLWANTRIGCPECLWA